MVIPFVGRKNGKLFDCQQSHNVLVLRVLRLEEGVMFGVSSIVMDGRNIHWDAGRAGQTYPSRATCWFLPSADGWRRFLKKSFAPPLVNIQNDQRIMGIILRFVCLGIPPPPATTIRPPPLPPA